MARAGTTRGDLRVLEATSMETAARQVGSVERLPHSVVVGGKCPFSIYFVFLLPLRLEMAANI